MKKLSPVFTAVALAAVTISAQPARAQQASAAPKFDAAKCTADESSDPWCPLFNRSVQAGNKKPLAFPADPQVARANLEKIDKQDRGIHLLTSWDDLPKGTCRTLEVVKSSSSQAPDFPAAVDYPAITFKIRSLPCGSFTPDYESREEFDEKNVALFVAPAGQEYTLAGKRIGKYSRATTEVQAQQQIAMHNLSLITDDRIERYLEVDRALDAALSIRPAPGK